MRALVVSLLLLITGLAGCLGGDQADTPVRRTAAEADAGSGGLQGVVTDIAVQPVPRATVRLVELALEARTADDGTYAFSRVPPGAYTVEAARDGFIPAALPATIEAGRVSSLDLLLQPIASAAAFSEIFEFQGFIECGVGGGLNQSMLPARPLPFSAASVAVCSLPNTVQENTTNDRFIHFFDLQPPVEGIVFEATWDPRGNPFAERLWLVIEVDPFYNDNNATLAESLQPGPIRIEVPKGRFVEVAEYLAQLCQDDPSSDACGINPWDNGWPLVLRAFADPLCLEDAAGACPYVQQDFTVYVSAFYNEPAPAGHSILGGSS